MPRSPSACLGLQTVICCQPHPRFASSLLFAVQPLGLGCPAHWTRHAACAVAKQQVISVQVADDEAEKLVDPCCSQQNSPIPVGVALLARRDSLTAENQIPAVRWASTAPQQPNTWDEVYESAFETAAFTRTTSGVSRSPGASSCSEQHPYDLLTISRLCSHCKQWSCCRLDAP